ncbi:sugar ABC transporter substrate-binding protein [Microbacterium sp. bgisy207]|uniref:sugar ABC transporter substrate-binding protein n=1 Tax=Microbacterium sp. bgisy207 TaxID=3413800 RepID=UPI003EBDADDF
MRTSIKAFAAATAVAALALAGCSSGGGDNGGGDNTEPTKVVAFTSGNQTPIGAWWVKDIEAKAAEFGWDLTMIQGDFDFQKMNPAVESAIGQGADLVYNGYTDVASIGSIVTAAKDAGIPMFAIDSGVEPTDAYALNITTDQQGIVDQTMGAIADALGGSIEGKNIMVIGHDPHAGIRTRAALAAEAVEAGGATLAGGEIQQVVSPATGRTEALALVADYLSANPGGLDAVWVGWDDAALGAVQAVTEAGATVAVTGVDATSEAIAAVKAGTMLATVEQPWPLINDAVLEAIQAWIETGTMPASNFEEEATTLVTKANADDITPSDKLG